ncbi:DUF732 domain-containing protein [Lentzea xinjiangensis]|nr:DUF732 domain-containing protein [Lentzea xinjiangensis]
MAVLAGAFALAGLAGGTAALLAANDQPVRAGTQSTATATEATPAANAKDTFVKMLRDQGVVHGPADEQIVYAEGDMYCRYFGEGLTVQQLMDNAGATGTAERAKSERVLSAAAATLCPQHAPKLMPQS